MIKVYGMPSCPDCQVLESQIEKNPMFELIDIGAHVLILKKFLHLRDTHPAFKEARENGWVGIPFFVTDDGKVTLDPEEVGLLSEE